MPAASWLSTGVQVSCSGSHQYAFSVPSTSVPESPVRGPLYVQQPSPSSRRLCRRGYVPILHMHWYDHHEVRLKHGLSPNKLDCEGWRYQEHGGDDFAASFCANLDGGSRGWRRRVLSCKQRVSCKNNV
jgi:hypothetical protein